jgi:hypothetical protein
MAQPICPRPARRKADFRRCPCRPIYVTGSATSGQPDGPPPRRIKLPSRTTYGTSTNSGTKCALQLSVASGSDDALVASFHQIDLSVSKGFEWQGLDDATKRGLARAIKMGEQIVDNKWEAAGETTNGWKYTFAGGRAGFDPGLRAALAKYEVGAQLSDQVIYPNTRVDDKDEPLTGAHKYVLHFDAGKLPPVIVFWNMAMYASDMLFVENSFARYSIGSTTDGLKKDGDGSLTILIQKDKPADTSNWLPAPPGNFNLTMRLYGPETSVLEGSYRLPAAHRVQ